MSRWYRFHASANRGCYYTEDFEAAIDRAMVDGYTRIPDDEVDAFYEDLARRSIAEEPW
jgi:hypothetical protein